MRASRLVPFITAAALLLSPVVVAHADSDGDGGNTDTPTASDSHHHPEPVPPCTPGLDVRVSGTTLVVEVTPARGRSLGDALDEPEPEPTETPVVMPTDFPTDDPTDTPTPVVMPTDFPTDDPTDAPTPVVMPTDFPTDAPATLPKARTSDTPAKVADRKCNEGTVRVSFETTGRRIDSYNVKSQNVQRFPGRQRGEVITVVAKQASAGAESTVTIPAGPPGTPTNFIPMEVTATSITMKWQPPLDDGGSKITKYRLDWSPPVGTVETANDEYTISALPPNTQITLSVKAGNSVGWSEYPASTVVTTKEAPLPPQPPRNLKTTDVQVSNVDLAWDPPALSLGQAVTGYEVRVNGAYYDTFKVTAAQISDLQPATDYTFEVRSLNASGPSAPASVSARTKPQPTVPGKVQNLKVTDVQPTSFTIDWLPPSDTGGLTLRGYSVYLDGKSFAYVNEPDFELPELEPEHEYRVSVTARNDLGESAPVSRTVHTSAPTVPTPVRELKATDIGFSSVRLNWMAPESDGGAPITKYLIRYGDAEVTSTGTTHQITGLASGTEYEFSVTAMNKAGESKPVAITARTDLKPIPNPLPTAPQSVSASTPTWHTMKLTWRPPTYSGAKPITGYAITWGDSGYQFAKGSEAVVGDLVAGTSYTFHVAAVNPYGTSEATDVTASTQPAIRPDGPQDVRQEGGDQTSILVAWDPPVSDGGSPILGYTVTLDGKPLAVLPPEQMTVLAENLDSATEYTFEVTARNAAGTSDPVELQAWTIIKPVPTPTPPPQPIDLQASGPTHTSMVLSWRQPLARGASLPATSYRITWDDAALEVTEPIAVITGLKPGHEYSFEVVAINNMGPSPAAGVSAWTLLNPVPMPEVPSAPRDVQATGPTTDSITLNWLPPVRDGGSPVLGYVVSWNGKERAVDTTSAQITGLQANTSYDFAVQAINTMGRSISATVRGTTRPAPGPTPGPTPGPAPAPKPQPITPVVPGTNSDGTLNADGNAASLRQTVPARWPKRTLLKSGQTVLVEKQAKLISNAGQDVKLAITYKSPSVKRASLALNPKTHQWSLRVWLKPYLPSGSVIVTASAPATTAHGKHYEPLQASQRFTIVDEKALKH